MNYTPWKSGGHLSKMKNTPTKGVLTVAKISLHKKGEDHLLFFTVQVLKLFWCPCNLCLYVCPHLKIIMPLIHVVLEECSGGSRGGGQGGQCPPKNSEKTHPLIINIFMFALLFL